MPPSANWLSDMDGDSQMGDATSSSSNSEDAMFPAANSAATWAADKSTHVQGAHPSSPPDSQTHQVENDRTEDLAGDTDEAKMAAGNTATDRFIPGASWNNTKARDDWQRAWAQLEDKSFSLKEFGDPFDESLPENKGPKT